MSPEVTVLSEQTKMRLIEANTSSTKTPNSFVKSWLIPSEIRPSTPRQVLGTEFLLRIGIIERDESAEEVERTLSALSELNRMFGELRLEEQQQYAKHLGGNLLTHLMEMNDLVFDYAGPILDAKIANFQAFMGYVVASTYSPEPGLPEI
ncbi:MAG: hypothetical protein ACYCPS_01120 [Candidatus Saccharimonadales bacterium]